MNPVLLLEGHGHVHEIAVLVGREVMLGVRIVIEPDEIERDRMLLERAQLGVRKAELE